MIARARGLSAAAVLLVLLPGCTSFADGVTADRAAAPSAEQPDPDRPTDELVFRLVAA